MTNFVNHVDSLLTAFLITLASRAVANNSLIGSMSTLVTGFQLPGGW